MTPEEFSNAFDTLTSTYSRNNFAADIAFDEYEKSVFLTKAQEDIVLSLYTGKNTYGEGFENTEEIRRYLSNIVKEATLIPITTKDGNPVGMESTSKFFTLPADTWFITYEAINSSNSKCGSAGVLDVYPVTQDEYHKVKRNPFRGASKRRALRLDLADGVIEIVCKYTITNYYLRYLRKPGAIILVTLPEDLTIDGVNTVSAYGSKKDQACELHEALHMKIVERAVQMALQSKGYSLKNNNSN